MKILASPFLFMYLMTGLFALHAIRNAFDWNLPQIMYGVGGVIINLAILSMGK